ncbi:hypothetical protein O181_079698 [Austropuccinia psidii MF-1]|uniref:Retroviral polymerase SH3-like domain-containing protein n=1 Tax=Austropuccinia psidii MF-1 TaxID=1389203 RepID=A0A9Q3FLI0_9BASI|nr:hypothetical protein [Austropuccinia psidii MF-1]
MFSAIVTLEDITQNCYLLWNKVNKQFASSSFNSKARVWSKFQKLTYKNNLKEFIANTRKCLSDIASVGIAVEDEILAFSILTKLPEEFHLLIEKVTLNADTQGNTDAIFNVLHEATLKEEALSTEPAKALALNKENFPSKVVHYCSNGRNNPLVTTHGPDKCWQLHPELKPERKKRDKEQKTNFTIAQALFTQNSKNSNTMLTLVPPYTPQHNPFSERNNCSVLEKERCILLQSKLPLKFWAEAESTATFLCNLIPKHENSVTPHKIWFKSKPPLHKLRTFGCQTWVKIPKSFVANKFASKAWDGILLVHEDDASSYQILRIHDQKIIISKHVMFNKERFPSLPSHCQNNKKIFNAFPALIQTSEDESFKDQPKDNSHNAKSISSNNEDEDSFVDVLEQQPQQIRVIGPRHHTYFKRNQQQKYLTIS